MFVRSLSVCIIKHNKDWFDLQTGECRCKTGYRGDRCQHECPDGRYGDGCEQRCSCPVGTKCNHMSGYCLRDCPAGWTGPRCNEREFVVTLHSWVSVCTGVRWYLPLLFDLSFKDSVDLLFEDSDSLSTTRIVWTCCLRIVLICCLGIVLIFPKDSVDLS